MQNISSSRQQRSLRRRLLRLLRHWLYRFRRALAWKRLRSSKQKSGAALPPSSHQPLSLSVGELEPEQRCDGIQSGSTQGDGIQSDGIQSDGIQANSIQAAVLLSSAASAPSTQQEVLPSADALELERSHDPNPQHCSPLPLEQELPPLPDLAASPALPELEIQPPLSAQPEWHAAQRKIQKKAQKISKAWAKQSTRQRRKTQAAQPPFDWILENRLAIGPLPRRGWLPYLERSNIKTIISLCGETEGKLPKELRGRFRCARVRLPDSRRQPNSLSVDDLAEAVALVHWNLQKRQPVYLHCLAGVERSPLVAIAYLCRHHAMDLLDATGWLSYVHPSSCPLPAQLKVVDEYLKD